MDTLPLIAISFLTSLWTAVMGVGGGLLLISVMPGFVPAAALVPIHGIVQLVSNASRAAFSRQNIEWRLVLPFGLGAVLGAAVGSRWVLDVPGDLILVLLGVFVLIVTWIPRRAFGFRVPGGFATLGAVETFVSLFVGPAGPLTAPFMLQEPLGRDRIVVTKSVFSLTAHTLKVVTYGLLGFAFQPYLALIAGMMLAVTLGSLVGTRLRGRVPEARFRTAFKIIISLLALRVILRLWI